MRLAETIFEKSELELMRRYGDAVRRTIMPKDATNPSKTALSLWRMLTQAFIKRTGSAAVFSGDPATGSAMFALSRLPIFRDTAATAAREAGKAVNAVAPKLLPRGPNAAALGGALGRNYGPEAGGALWDELRKLWE